MSETEHHGNYLADQTTQNRDLSAGETDITLAYPRTLAGEEVKSRTTLRQSQRMPHADAGRGFRRESLGAAAHFPTTEYHEYGVRTYNTLDTAEGLGPGDSSGSCDGSPWSCSLGGGATHPSLRGDRNGKKGSRDGDCVGPAQRSVEIKREPCTRRGGSDQTNRLVELAACDRIMITAGPRRNGRLDLL